MDISNQIDYSLSLIAERQKQRQNEKGRQGHEDRFYDHQPRAGGSRQPTDTVRQQDDGNENTDELITPRQ